MNWRSLASSAASMRVGSAKSGPPWTMRWPTATTSRSKRASPSQRRIAPTATRWSTRPWLSSKAYSLVAPDTDCARNVALAPSPSIWPVASASRPAASWANAANFTDDEPAFKVRINPLTLSPRPRDERPIAKFRPRRRDAAPQVVRRGYMRAATSVKTQVNAARMAKSVNRPYSLVDPLSISARSASTS